jgi:hypothetical protein
LNLHHRAVKRLEATSAVRATVPVEHGDYIPDRLAEQLADLDSVSPAVGAGQARRARAAASGTTLAPTRPVRGFRLDIRRSPPGEPTRAGFRLRCSRRRPSEPRARVLSSPRAQSALAISSGLPRRSRTAVSSDHTGSRRQRPATLHLRTPRRRRSSTSRGSPWAPRLDSAARSGRRPWSGRAC